MHSYCFAVLSYSFFLAAVVVDGPKGIVGVVGDTGEKGDTGVPGMEGDMGIRGPLGMKGITGDEGQHIIKTSLVVFHKR